MLTWGSLTGLGRIERQNLLPGDAEFPEKRERTVVDRRQK